MTDFPKLKSHRDIDKIKAESDGQVKIVCLSTISLDSIPEHLSQRLVLSEEGLVLIVPDSILQIPNLISQTVRDYINHLECLDYHQNFDNFRSVFTGLIEKTKQILPFEHKYITNNKREFVNRLFGAGSPPFSKVKDAQIREELISDLGPRSEYYPDEQNTNHHYSMLFYCSYKYPPNQLDNPSFELNLEVISHIISLLERVINNRNLKYQDLPDFICKKKYLKKFINILLENPQTSDLLKINKYRNNASTRSKAVAFHFQLVGEQMSKKWDREISTWTPENTVDLEKVGDYESLWMLHQIPVTKQRQKFVFNITCYRNNSVILNRLPQSSEIEERFNNITQFMLSETSNEFIQSFYGDDLLISGSLLSYTCSFHPDDDNSKMYSNSDIDCPILAGDGVFLSSLELKSIAEKKMLTLRKYFPSGYQFELVPKEKRWQIKNKANNLVFELYSIPFSLKTCPIHFSNYHLGQVRGYLRYVPGEEGYGYLDVQLLPSSIPALLLRVSLDIRYCSANRPPQSIILKNEQRGFSTILNKRETDSQASYLVRNLPDISSVYELSLYYFRNIYKSGARLINLLPPSFNFLLYFIKDHNQLSEHDWNDIPESQRIKFQINEYIVVKGLSRCRKFIMNHDKLWAPILSTNYNNYK